MTTRIFYVLLFLPILLIEGCKDESVIALGENYPKQIIIPNNRDKRPDLVPAEPQKLLVAETNTDPHKISNFLSGKWVEDKQDSLNDFTKSKAYNSYKENLARDWLLYNKVALNPFKEWLVDNFKYQYSDTILYPFSGPDLPNVLTIYPNASKYVMIGLEPAGFLPDFRMDSDEKKAKGLHELNSSLDSISRLNFFLTNKMKVNITSSIYSGTAPVIVAYLGLLGFEPLSVKPIIIDTSGNVHYLSSEEINSDPGFKKGHVSTEIQFKDPNSNQKKVLYYLSANVSNQGFDKEPHIMTFLNSLGKFSSTFKAASFLLHYENFSKMKNYILENSDLVVMDDTGPRIKDLKTDFEIKVYGIYTRPIALWPNMFQSDLKELHILQKPKEIPFKYGYGTLNKTYHLIIAHKNK
jgi:hypothetical protein